MRTEELSTVGNQLKITCKSILSGGGNVSTEYYPGSFRAIGSKYKVSGVTVSNVWNVWNLLTFCQTRENLPLHAAARGQPKRLAKPELDLVQLLIKCRTSRTYKSIKENIEEQSMATASIYTIGRAVRDHLPEGKMTWKKMMRPAGKKFTPDNQVGYFKVAEHSFEEPMPNSP